MSEGHHLTSPILECANFRVPKNTVGMVLGKLSYISNILVLTSTTLEIYFMDDKEIPYLQHCASTIHATICRLNS